MTRSRSTVLFTVTGVLWALAMLISPDVGVDPGPRYAHVLAHQTREGIAGLIFIVVAVLWVCSALSAIAERYDGRGVGATRVGVVMLGIGSVWFSVTYAAFYMFFLQLLQNDVPKATVGTLIDGGAEPWQNYFDLALVAVIFGPAVLAFGLWRNGRTSWLPMALWLVGVFAYAATDFAPRPIPSIAILVCTAGLFLMGRGIDIEGRVLQDAL